MSLTQSIVSRLGSVASLFTEVPEVARYVTVGGTAGGFSVPDNSDFPVSDRHIQGIHAPGLVIGLSGVIFFRTRHVGQATFSVRLNSTRLTQHTFTGDGLHSWHEIIPAGALRPQDNELTFNVGSGGRVVFSDVVVLYTSNQLTVRRPAVLDPSPG